MSSPSDERPKLVLGVGEAIPVDLPIVLPEERSPRVSPRRTVRVTSLTVAGGLGVRRKRLITPGR